MLQAAKHVGLLLKTTQQLTVDESRLDDLESDDAVRVLLLSLVDAAHSAFAD